MPGDLGGTCGDYARVLFHFAREAAGAAAPPAFPAPSVFRGAKRHAGLGREHAAGMRSCVRRVEWAKRKRAHHLKPRVAMVGTAQARLCPPYEARWRGTTDVKCG